MVLALGGLALLLRPILASANTVSLNSALPEQVAHLLPQGVTILRSRTRLLVVALAAGYEPQAALMDASVKGAPPRVYPLSLAWSGGRLGSVLIGKPRAAAGSADYGLGASDGYAYYATAVGRQFQTVTLTRGGTQDWLFALGDPAEEVRLTPGKNALQVAYLVGRQWRQGVISLGQAGPRSASKALRAVETSTASGNSVFIRLVESVRQHLGSGIVAAIEDLYYNLADSAQRIVFHLSGQRAGTPTLAALPGKPAGHSEAVPDLPKNITLPAGWPAAAGEGVWHGVGPLVHGHPAMEETFLHPDPQRPWATSYLVWIDPRLLTVHYQTGLHEPVAASGVHGPGLLPTDPAELRHVVATFNSGFKTGATPFGAMLDGELLDPPVNGVATFAIYRGGRVALGAWGSASVPRKGIVSFRQNLPLIEAGGVASPLLGDPSAWGVVVGNSTYVWRSGLGITPAGDLIYVAGNPLSAYTLANTFVAAGAVRAMQLDINAYWATFNFYRWVGRNSSGHLVGTKLTPAIERSADRYLTPDTRDFFYLTLP